LQTSKAFQLKKLLAKQRKMLNCFSESKKLNA
jgi:hypothetical protein